MTNWTQAEIDQLKTKNGFRLRGLEMTRLEVFTDAAFAFAITMLIISLSKIPGSLDELHAALKDVPGFLASFASITHSGTTIVSGVENTEWKITFPLCSAWGLFLPR